MRSVPLGKSDTISEIMLGTMTFGTQTSETDSHRQIDMAIDAGVTWLDTAEMYPVNPMAKETIGVTEGIIGRWWAAGGAGRIRIATKHPGEGTHANDGAPITAASIPRSIEGSLKRLQCETIDLYQFHWPNRGSYMFRQNWTYRPKGERAAIRQDIADCIGALEAEIARGTITSFGMSNESTWGLMNWIEAAGDRPARVASVQNEYSLMCRLADTDLAELMVHEQVTMLAFSPLATGLLTGKYAGGAVPDASRKTLNESLGGRWNDRAVEIASLYVDLAAKHGVDPVHMALAWQQTRPFACSAILGATTSEQLEHGLKAQDLTLTPELIEEIDALHRAHPMPY